MVNSGYETVTDPNLNFKQKVSVGIGSVKGLTS